MMERPEPLEFFISVAHTAKDDTIYQIDFRPWQLRAIRDYIKELEIKVQTHGQQ
jgi:hypothetical protein